MLRRRVILYLNYNFIGNEITDYDVYSLFN